MRLLPLPFFVHLQPSGGDPPEWSRRGITVSPSQIGSAADCLTLWGLEKIEKLESTSDALELGKLVHSQIERWLLDAIPPDDSRAGELARCSLPYLPNPRLSRERVEAEFWALIGYLEDGTPVWWHGLIDVNLIAGGEPLIIDHKTCQPNRVKTIEELRDDPQWLIYGAVLHSFTGSNVVRTQWNYMKKQKDPKCVPVADRFDVREPWWYPLIHGLQGASLELAALRKRVPRGAVLKMLPKNPASCGRFGGCSHVAICGTESRSWFANVEGKTK